MHKGSEMVRKLVKSHYLHHDPLPQLPCLLSFFKSMLQVASEGKSFEAIYLLLLSPNSLHRKLVRIAHVNKLLDIAMPDDFESNPT